MAVPLVPPKHKTGVEGTDTNKGGGSGKFIDACVEQPVESVMMITYVPAESPVAVWPVPAEVGDHTYVYGGCPPVSEALNAPLLPPLQETVWVALTMMVGLLVTGMLKDFVTVQPLASVIVTL